MITPTDPSGLLIIGCGYSGQAISRAACQYGMTVTGTYAQAAHRDAVADSGATPLQLDLADALADGRGVLLKVVLAHQAVIYSVGPGRTGGEQFDDHTLALAELLRQGIGRRPFVYLSSTGVYGNRDGAWVDEQTPMRAGAGPRGAIRQQVESGLLRAGREWGLNLRILRLAGIYGPGRHIGGRLLAGNYRVIEAEPPLVVNRIHVDDLAQTALRAIERGRAGAVYVVADGHPATLREVGDYAAKLLQRPPPEGEPLAAAAQRLGAANVHLVADRKRCRNRKMVHELGVKLAYPSYREGLRHAFQADGLMP